MGKNLLLILHFPAATFPLILLIMQRTITVHPEKSIQFTPAAKKITQELNEYRRANGEVSLKEMARIFNMRERNCARYYYGTHHFFGGYVNGSNYTPNASRCMC